MKPRDLPVYQAPVIPQITVDGYAGWSIAPEGFVTKDSSLTGAAMALPAFDDLNKQRYFIDVFWCDEKQVSWTATVSHNWIRLSKNSGTLSAGAEKNDMRIWVDIDWSKAPKAGKFTGKIIFKGPGRQMAVTLQTGRLNNPALVNFNGFIENNGFVSMQAAHFTRAVNKSVYQWKEVADLGYSGKVVESLPVSIKNEPVSADAESIKKNNSCIEYDFYTVRAAKPEVHVFTLPTHPLNNKFSMRYAVSIDAGPVTVVDFKTVGRSEEWKRNVLSNRAARTIQGPLLKKGAHTLKIYCIDPGVMLDEIRIDLGGLKEAYGPIPETKAQDKL
jgi:hypothetical protein